MQNRFALSSCGNFSTRFPPFSAHVPTITSTSLPLIWAQENASFYITFPLQSQNAVGPLSAALIAGLVRQIQASPPGKRVLFAIDQLCESLDRDRRNIVWRRVVLLRMLRAASWP
jgi:hypothetical protein